ncbi:MAG: aromatic amino acid transport family protein [Patescibacteria group bacterium]
MKEIKLSKGVYYLEGIGLLTGMIIGAGIFALPFVMAQSGIFWGLTHFLVALALVLIIQELYGEVAFLTEGKHRFTGYVYKYLGLSASRLALVLTLIGYYGSLLAYGILGGIFLNNIFHGIFGGVGVFGFSIVFFIVANIFSLVRFEKIGVINFYLTIPLLFFIIYLVAASWQWIDIDNFVWDFSFNGNWFLPYGVWLFALTGFSVIPEVRDIMRSTSLRDFKIVIFISTMIAAVFSLIFALGVLGVTGMHTSEEALAGLVGFLGTKGLIIGSIIGFLAVFTSYLSTIADFKELFRTDYGVNIYLAWLACILPPVLLFWGNIIGLVDILGFIGAAGLGISGVFILEMADKMMTTSGGARLNPYFKWLVALGIVVASVYETWNIVVK